MLRSMNYFLFDLPKFLLLPCCLLTFTVMGCQRAQEKTDSKAEKTVPRIQAEIMTVQKERWPHIVRGQGSLYPDEEATLGIKVEGRVVEINADLGDVVKAGAPLLTLYQDDFLLQVEQAEAQLRQARSAIGLQPGDPVEMLQPVNAPQVREQRALWDEATANLNRARDLLARNALVQSEYDQIASIEQVSAARYDSALNNVREKIALIHVQQAMLGLARENLDNSVLKAPFDAVVQRRLVAPGSYVKVGDPLFVLVRVDRLRYRGTVPERLSQLVQTGQQIELKIESIAEPRKTTVSRISPFLDQVSRALLFEAILDNSDFRLRAGLFAEARVIVNPVAESVVIPVTAMVRFAGTEKVWKVVNGTLAEQVISVGDQREDLISVTSGLQPGDVILKDASRGQSGAELETLVISAASGT